VKHAIGLALAACAWSASPTASAYAQQLATASAESDSKTEAGQEELGQSLHMRMTSGAPNQYFFRGLFQNDKGFIGQANANLDVALYDSKALKVMIPVGFWFSLHPGNQAKSGKGPAAWYESRLSSGLVLANDYFRADARLVVYSSPNGSFRDVYELDLVGELHDDAWWTRGNERALFRGIFPTLTLATEVKGARDGQGSGTFMELRAEPRVRLLANRDWIVEVATPAALGVSLHDYYQIWEVGHTTPTNHGLGYASIGALFDIAPLLIPRRLGLYNILPSLDLLFPTAYKDAAKSPSTSPVQSVEIVAQIFSMLRF
jgi:hypothetical protein